MKDELRELVRRSRGTRWLRLWWRFARKVRPRLRRQLAFGGANQNAAPRRIFVPLIETSHYQSNQVLLIARLLQQRGHIVKVLLCDSQLEGCEVKSVRMKHADPCLNCRFSRRHVVPMFNLDTALLGDYVSRERVAELQAEARQISIRNPSRYEHLGVDLIPHVNDSVLRYYYGALPDAPSPELLDRRAQFLATAMLSTEVAHAVHEAFQPDVVFTHMNVYAEWAPYHRYFSARGVRSATVSISQFNYHALLFDYVGVFASPRRFHWWRSLRSDSRLSDAERAELNAFLGLRFAGLSQVFTENSYFKDAPASVQQQLGIDPGKRNVFLFPNVFWDVGMAELASLFDGVIEWVCETIRILGGRADCHLYIKTHPAEEFDGASSLKGVWQHVRERFPILPANVTHIAPSMQIKPYDLFPYVDVGVVYGGTIGLEMMLRGIPVVLASVAPYGGLGLVEEPSTLEEYIAMLSGDVAVKVAEPEAALLFAYFYFIKTLIPWNLTRRAYADTFEGFCFGSVSDVEAGANRYLDHLLQCIVDSDRCPEDWQ